MYTVVASLSYILPKCAKTREPKDEHCVSWCTYMSNDVCSPIHLHNPKNHIALPYITWGLIQDFKIKKEIPPEIRFEVIESYRISKIRQRYPN